MLLSGDVDDVGDSNDNTQFPRNYFHPILILRDRYFFIPYRCFCSSDLFVVLPSCIPPFSIESVAFEVNENCLAEDQLRRL